MEVERLDILRRCSSTTVFQNDKLRALPAVTFPPVTVGPLAGRSVPAPLRETLFPSSAKTKRTGFIVRCAYRFRSGPWKTGNRTHV